MSFYSTKGKRALDLLLSSVALAVALPALALLAVLTRINLGSPVIFKQIRPGMNGQPFTLLKFRSMTEARGLDGRLLSDFSRRSRFGDFIRRFSLDELPQLLNVIKGEMSVVGPRPLLCEYLDYYSTEQHRRHEVRPGITGYSQVLARNTTTWDERLAGDTWYVDNLSLRLDLWILCKTLMSLAGRGSSIEEAWTLGKFQGSGQEPDRSGQVDRGTKEHR